MGSILLLVEVHVSWVHDKEGIRADVSAPAWSANYWLAPEGTKILPADQSEADTSAHVSPYHDIAERGLGKSEDHKKKRASSSLRETSLHPNPSSLHDAVNMARELESHQCRVDASRWTYQDNCPKLGHVQNNKLREFCVPSDYTPLIDIQPIALGQLRSKVSRWEEKIVFPDDFFRLPPIREVSSNLILSGALPVAKHPNTRLALPSEMNANYQTTRATPETFRSAPTTEFLKGKCEKITMDLWFKFTEKQ
ncbi:hypothetical protein Tco_1563666 [Tanacetum coccineum]